MGDRGAAIDSLAARRAAGARATAPWGSAGASDYWHAQMDRREFAPQATPC
jgi:hypothetical protein